MVCPFLSISMTRVSALPVPVLSGELTSIHGFSLVVETTVTDVLLQERIAVTATSAGRMDLLIFI